MKDRFILAFIRIIPILRGYRSVNSITYKIGFKSLQPRSKTQSGLPKFLLAQVGDPSSRGSIDHIRLG